MSTSDKQIAEARLAGCDPTDKGSFVDDLLRLTHAADALESAIAGKVPQLAARLTTAVSRVHKGFSLQRMMHDANWKIAKRQS